uniref:Ig-like domain-containing protein n=1 Tax=Mastacembelus armatus TaxID=205130 RepID=A0A3Q3NFK3_9TELE
MSFNCSVTHDRKTKTVEVISFAPSIPPHVSLLSEPRGDTQNFVCTIGNFSPKELSVKWKKNQNEVTGGLNWVPQKTGQTYSAVSMLNVKNTEWANDDVYTCEVNHEERTYTKTVPKVPVTVTLNQPSPKKIFINNQVELECVVTGQDKNIVDKTTITWEIDGQSVTSNINDQTKSEGRQHNKVSTLTRSYSDWKTVNKVRCSASSENMTPVIQELTVHKAAGQQAHVDVNIVSEEKSADVTLVCVVSSGPLQQDYYIAWSVDEGRNTGNYVDGINFSPQKTANGYLFTSVYTTKKNDNKTFHCHAWSAGRDRASVASKTATTHRVPVTVTLNQPSPKKIFINNQVELECVVTGQDKNIVDKTTITWEIDGQSVTSNINDQTKSEGRQHNKVSTLTRTYSDWKTVNKVRCSASSENMTPVIQELTVHKAAGQQAHVEVNIVSEEKSADVTLVCVVSSGPLQQDYYIAWSVDEGRNTGNYVDGINFSPRKTANGYLFTCVYTTKKNDNKTFHCHAWPAGRDRASVASKTATTHRVPVTVTLNQPSSKKIFINNQVELECVVTGQDKNIVDKTTITWEIDGQSVTNNIYDQTKSEGRHHNKVSTLTRTYSDWKKVSKVRCSASSENMTPVIQELTVHKAAGQQAHVEVNIVSEEKSADVTLVCVVSSGPLQQDYYIAWSVDEGRNTGNYVDGINFSPQKTANGYLFTSVYTTKKNDNKTFSCHAWSAGRDRASVASKTATTHRVPVTVTLNQPSSKKIFINNQVELECVVTGQDKNIVDKTTITWEIDGQSVTNNINDQTKSEGRHHNKVSTLTRSYSDWKTVSKVRCSASSENMTPVIQELTVHKAAGQQAHVDVNIVSEEKSADVTLVCVVSSGPLQQDYYIAWSVDEGRNTGNYVDGINFSPQKTANGYLFTSVYTTKKNDNKTFHCHAWSAGRDRASVASKTATTHRVPVTVTLNQPSPKKIFINNQVELECVVTGQDKSIVDKTTITWEIDGQSVTSNINDQTKSEGRHHNKTSTLTRSYSDWKTVNKVCCSASSENMTPVIQELTVHKAAGQQAHVDVNIVSEEKSADVTLVCVVSSGPLQQDYYIAWSVDEGRNTGNYVDGINFSPQKTANGYLFTSVYTTKKNDNKTFHCHAWSAGRDRASVASKTATTHRDCPSASNLTFLSCTDQSIEEDELSSLWSTASSFIFLFICSFIYSMIFSLVKMKRD